MPRPSEPLPLAFVRPPPEVPARVAAWLMPATLDPDWPQLPPTPIQEDETNDEDEGAEDEAEPQPRDPQLVATTCPVCGTALPIPPQIKQRCPGCDEQLELRVDHHGVWHYLSRIDAYDYEAQVRAALAAEIAAGPTEFEQAIADWENEVKRMGVFIGDYGPMVTTDGVPQEKLLELLMALDDGSAALQSGPQVIAELKREVHADDPETVAIVIHGLTVAHLGSADAHRYQKWLLALATDQRPALVVARLTGGQPTRSGGRGPVKVEIDGMPGPI